jgi:hypothetical protein
MTGPGRDPKGKGGRDPSVSGADGLTLEIAGVAFRLEGPAPFAPGDHHLPFLAPGEPPPGSDLIRVRLKEVAGLTPPAGRPEMEAGGSWSLVRRGNEYLFFLTDAPRGETLWRARFRFPVESVDLETSRGVRAFQGPPLDHLLTMFALASRRGLVVHAAGFGLEGRGYLLAGVSGAGKTTISRLLLAACWSPLSDDRVAVREREGRFLVHGTPWPGEALLAVNGAFPLEGILFLRHGPDHALLPLEPGDALRRLYRVASLPWFDPSALGPSLSVGEDLVRRIQAWELTFRPDASLPHFLGGALARKASR